MDISQISSILSTQQDVMKQSTQPTGGDFKDALTAALANDDDAALKESCDQVEAYMLGMVFKQMMDSMLQGDDDEDALIPKGDYVKTFKDNMINMVTEKMVEAGGIGLSTQIYNQAKTAYSAQMQLSSLDEA